MEIWHLCLFWISPPPLPFSLGSIESPHLPLYLGSLHPDSSWGGGGVMHMYRAGRLLSLCRCKLHLFTGPDQELGKDTGDKTGRIFSDTCLLRVSKGREGGQGKEVMGAVKILGGQYGQGKETDLFKHDRIQHVTCFDSLGVVNCPPFGINSPIISAITVAFKSFL